LNVGRHLAWFGLGFCAITILGVVVDPRPVRAQGTNTSITTINPPPRAQPVPQRQGGVATPFDPSAGQQPRRGQTLPAPIPDDQNGDGTGDGSDDRDADGTPTPVIVGQRSAPRDGDLTTQDGPTQDQDGVLVTGEPRPPQDGADATVNDTRSAEEIALFENPPAGFDPQLFLAEVDPILDRRPERLFRFEPYAARGFRVGSFILLPEAEFGSTYFSNVFRSTKPRSDFAFDVRPSARLVSNWRAHALEFRATGNLSRFTEFTTENDRAYTLESRGRIDLSKRTNIEALVSRDVAQDSRSSINAPASAANRADITTDRVAAALNHRFNRLSIQLRGSLTEAKYGPSEAIGGGTIGNNDRDLRTTEEAVRATWEFKPTLFTFIETAINQRSYKTAALSDGILRDSNGERYRAGISFGNAGQRLRGEFSIGYGTQRPDDRRLREISGFLFDANLAYRYSALTSFLLTARSDVTETTLANSGGAFSNQIGLEARHAFHRYLIGNAGVSYTVQDYEGVTLQEREWRSTAGLEYFVNHAVTLFGRYQHTAFDSTDRSRNYNADEVRVGVRVRQ
jgi:hypothetical protein